MESQKWEGERDREKERGLKGKRKEKKGKNFIIIRVGRSALGKRWKCTERKGILKGRKVVRKRW